MMSLRCIHQPQESRWNERQQGRMLETGLFPPLSSLWCGAKAQNRNDSWDMWPDFPVVILKPESSLGGGGSIELVKWYEGKGYIESHYYYFQCCKLPPSWALLLSEWNRHNICSCLLRHPFSPAGLIALPLGVGAVLMRENSLNAPSSSACFPNPIWAPLQLLWVCLFF